MDNNLVSVVMITYAHQDYIKQAVEGVLMQEYKGKIELIIANDKSPDTTDEIVRKIIYTHPKGSWIKYTSHESNLGMMHNFIYSLKQCTGKYIAICEGDDYWTDIYKLQKQVDALERNPQYSLCFHNSKVIYENSEKESFLFNKVNQKHTLYFEDLIERWQIATASILYKNLIVNYPDWFEKQYNGDMAIQFLLIGHGPFLYLEDLMSVYRIHDTGISNTKNTSQVSNIKSIINLLDLVNDYYSGIYKITIEKYKFELYKMMRNVKIKNKYPFIQQLRIFLKRKLALIGDKL